MAFEILVEKRVAKYLQKLDRHLRIPLEAAISSLADEPRPPKSRELEGYSDGRRKLRVGDYRILYLVKDVQVQVLIIRVGHRQDVYKGL